MIGRKVKLKQNVLDMPEEDPTISTQLEMTLVCLKEFNIQLRQDWILVFRLFENSFWIEKFNIDLGIFFTLYFRKTKNQKIYSSNLTGYLPNTINILKFILDMIFPPPKGSAILRFSPILIGFVGLRVPV